MTVAQWKEMVLNAAATMEAWSYLINESAEFSSQTVRVYLNILTEGLPGLSDESLERMFLEATEYDIDPDMATFDNLHRKLETTQTDEEWEEISIQIIEQAIFLLMQVQFPPD